MILLSEIAAGRWHFRNYRHFMSVGGLRHLIEESKLTIEKEKIVAMTRWPCIFFVQVERWRPLFSTIWQPSVLFR